MKTKKMKKMNKVIFYSIYKIDTDKHDIVLINQFDKLKQVEDYFNIKNISNYKHDYIFGFKSGYKYQNYIILKDTL